MMKKEKIVIGSIAIIGFIGTLILLQIIFDYFEVENNTSAIMSMVAGIIIVVIILMLSGILKKFTVKGAGVELSGTVNETDDKIKTMINETGLNFESENNEKIEDEIEPRAAKEKIEKIKSYIEINQKMKTELEPPIEFNEELSMTKAGFYFKTKNYSKSMELLDLILDKNPKNFQALARKGGVLLRQEKFEDAIIFYDLALEIKKSKIILLRKAIALEYLKKYDMALRIIDNILEKNPKDIHILLHKGVLLGKMEKIDDALEIFNKGLEIDPNSLQMLTNKATAQIHQKKDKDAISTLEKILEIQPSDTRSMIRLCHLKERTGDEKDAILLIDKVLKIEPDNSHALKHKGEALCKLEKYEDGILMFNLGLKFDHDSTNLDIWIGKGDALKKMWKLEEALECYDIFLEKKPMDVDVTYKKSGVLMVMGKKIRALELLEIAIISNPKLKEQVKKNEDFKNILDDEKFQKIIS